MKRGLLILGVAVLLGGCSRSEGRLDAEFRRWNVEKVYVLVDAATYMTNLQRALAKGGRGAANIKNNPPVYVVEQGRLIAFTDEGVIPGGVSFSPMTPLQALHTAKREPGSQGLCVDPSPGGACRAALSLADIDDLGERLFQAGQKAESLPFALMRRPR